MTKAAIPGYNALTRPRERLVGRHARPPAAGGEAWYNGGVAMFLVTIRRSGRQWDAALPLEEQSGWDGHAAFMDALVDQGFLVLGGPLADGDRVVHAVEAESQDEVRATLARDPWSETHLIIEAIEPWEIRLDGRRD